MGMGAGASVSKTHPNVASDKDTNCQRVQRLGSKVKEVANCKWMYGDAAEGYFGVHALAPLNPLRWSGLKTIGNVIEDLRELQQKEDHRIIVKVPPGEMSNEVKLKSIEEAIKYLEARRRGDSHEAARESAEKAAAAVEIVRKADEIMYLPMQIS